MKKQLSFQEKLLKLTKQQKKKTNLHVFIASLIVFCLMFVCILTGKAETPSVKRNADDLVSASFVGDIMMGRNVEKVTKHKGTESVFRYAKPFFEASDYVSGNFENPVTYKRTTKKQKKYPPSVKQRCRKSIEGHEFHRSHGDQQPCDGLRPSRNEGYG